MNLFKFLNSNNYVTFNREIAHEIGLNATIMLSEIIDKYEFFSASGQLDEEGWFYLTIDVVEERTTLAKDAQAGAVKVLKELGLIECKQKGMPAKRHFRVIKEKFAERWNSSNKKEETRQQDRGNSENKIAEKPPAGTYDASIYKEPKEEPNIVCIGADKSDQNGTQFLVKINSKGEEHTISLQDIFAKSVTQRKSWDSQEIHDCWKILSDYKGIVNDPMGYFEGTIRRLRNQKRANFLNGKKGELRCQKKEKKELKKDREILSADDSKGRPSLQSLLEKEMKKSSNGSKAERTS